MSQFDKIINRHGTGSYKWDSRKDVTPLWVADMDFQTAPCIIDALEERVRHGIFGYTLVRDDYYDALIDWFSTRHLYMFSRYDVIYTSGVVPAISAIIKALIAPGEGVIVQTPVYNCFFSSIRNNDCKIVENELIREDLDDLEFTYRMDFEGLERLASDHDNKMLLLCNPHNPAGRCWSREELQRLHEICSSHGVMVVSDEIHCELTMPGLRYTPYGTIDKNAIICLSPSKAFNTAGLQIANIICTSPELRAKIDKAININEVCDVNPFGVEALIAAYSPAGNAWLSDLREYLYQNYLYTKEFISRTLHCPITRLDATYLPWVDISPLGMTGDELEEKLLNEAKVWVNSGVMYGKDGYMRLNIACPRSILEEAFEQMEKTLITG
ncbi:MAG: pyridoxal phosphate-dependent aminotransferase [Duncaniella sp.]|nr:pyridoxal phosphate-dependent aminotransferase [Muribaculum sp.]MCM1256052.1 pyridoxal phosphate-dependent aminotransferase [Duncaniella sp.]